MVIKKRFAVDFDKIVDVLENIKDLNVLVIGDTIIDEYVFAKQKGRAIKDPILSMEYVNHEVYAGGIYATANHLSSFVKNITLVTLLGDKETKEDFLKSHVSKNTRVKHFFKKDSVTTVKKRFVDSYRGNKLFKIEHITDAPISNSLSKEIVSYLEEELPKYDLVVVNDFGHGFINEDIRSVIQKKSKYLAINVQSNSANTGFNYVTLYTKADFITMNESEIRLPMMMRFEDIDVVMNKFSEKYFFDKFILTLGKRGSIYYTAGETFACPVVIDTIVDTVGSGDALFAISSLFSYSGADGFLISFIGNVAGGIKTNYLGNKESVSKNKLIKVSKELLL
ncbi:hypothetical protein K9L67_01215 [Candidatus Woesearchaeota archaeon]|nr:hypothetical protein [Candidatus Woesearchaeota archaeon]MCF8013125.1 hypothetical protein [Candidatus Woesearchaeota archaeon]